MRKLNSRRNAVKGLRIDSYCIMNRILSIILLLIPLSAGATDNLVLQLDNMIKSAKTGLCYEYIDKCQRYLLQIPQISLTSVVHTEL